MVVGISVFELHLPGARSLKEKRRIVRSLVERIRGRHRVSVYESSYLDLHQRAEIAVAHIGPNQDKVAGVLEAIRDLVESQPDCTLSRWQPEFLDAL